MRGLREMILLKYTIVTCHSQASWRIVHTVERTRTSPAHRNEGKRQVFFRRIACKTAPRVRQYSDNANKIASPRE